MYDTIINPETGNSVNIFSQTGKKVLTKYLMYNQCGGSGSPRSRISRRRRKRGCGGCCGCKWLADWMKDCNNWEMVQLVNAMLTPQPAQRRRRRCCEHGLVTGCKIKGCLGPY